MVARTLTTALESAVRSFPVVTVTGPRQSGKTTLLRTAFPDYHYVNLEAVDQRRIAEEDPRGLIGRHLERGIVIDAAQRVPDLFSYVQTIVDEQRTIGEVILSGSQHLLLLERITQSLAGRAMILHLHPFTVLELPAVLGGPVDTAMFNGMYPPLHDRKIDPGVFYPTYIQSYVERDVRSVRNVGDLSTFSRFLQLCAGRIGSLLTLSALANETGATLNREFTRTLRKFQSYSGIAPERCHLVYGGEIGHAGEPAHVWAWRHLPEWVDAVSR